MPTQYSTFKIDVIKVGLVFSISNFFINEIYQANELSAKKYFLARIWLQVLKYETPELLLILGITHIAIAIKHCARLDKYPTDSNLLIITIEIFARRKKVFLKSQCHL